MWTGLKHIFVEIMTDELTSVFFAPWWVKMCFKGTCLIDIQLQNWNWSQYFICCILTLSVNSLIYSMKVQDSSPPESLCWWIAWSQPSLCLCLCGLGALVIATENNKLCFGLYFKVFCQIWLSKLMVTSFFARDHDKNIIILASKQSKKLSRFE